MTKHKPEWLDLKRELNQSRAKRGQSKADRRKKLLKGVGQATAITAAYFAGVAILLWPAVDAARLM